MLLITAVVLWCCSGRARRRAGSRSDLYLDPGLAQPPQTWRPSPRHVSCPRPVPPSVTCTLKRAEGLEGLQLWTSWKGRTTMPPPPLPRLLFTATPPLATTLVLWTPMDHPLMAVSSLWAAGRPVLWCLCPPARDSVHLCMHPAITIWKPPQHPSTGKRMHLIHERVTKLEKWKKVVYFFPPLFYLEANFIVLLFDDSSSTVEFFNQFRSLSWCCHVFSSYFRCIFHEEVREVELVCF